MGTREILDVRLEQVEHNGGNNGSGGDGSWEEVAGRHPRHQAGPRPLQHSRHFSSCTFFWILSLMEKLTLYKKQWGFNGSCCGKYNEVSQFNKSISLLRKFSE